MPQRTLKTNQHYHVFNRGFNKQIIFPNKTDSDRFKRKIKILSKKHNVSIFSIALMKNHYHLLTKQPEEKNISRFIQALQSSHTQYFNYKYPRRKQMFEGSYKAKTSTSIQYHQTIRKYILLNPINKILEIEIKDFSSINNPFPELSQRSYP